MNVPLLLGYVAMSVAGGLGMYLGIASIFEWLFYRRRRDQAEEWKCQPRRWAKPSLRRAEILLGTANMTGASIASGCFAYYLATGGRSSVYFDLTEHGAASAVATAVIYFVATDCGLYWAHRILHRPALFRAIHRWHHRQTVPTAFTAMSMHPLEFLTYQSVMFIPLFFWPMHVVGLVTVLIYQNYVALVDHSGVRMYSWWPWQPPSQFHDDHHVHFHVNYGQNMGVWDWMFGTYRRQGRRYGADVFGGRGAALSSGQPDEPPRYVDYSRDAVEASVRVPSPRAAGDAG